MNRLIEALQIFAKYKDLKYPTMCDHDILYIVGIAKNTISAEDQKRLKKLDFFWEEDSGCWISHHFGAA